MLCWLLFNATPAHTDAVQQPVTHSLFPKSTVVNKGSFHMSFGMLPLNRLLVALKLTSLVFVIPTGTTPVNRLSCSKRCWHSTRSSELNL